MAWVTKSEARKLWKSAPADDDVLDLYLEAVKPSLIAYAPALADPAVIPENWKLAQVLQARNLFNAGVAPVRSDDPFDGSGFGATTYPLDWQVKQLLWPVRGLGAIA